MSLVSARAFTLFVPAVVALTVTVSGCKIFKTNCAEDDKSGCLGGGTLRSGDICVRSGDCAVGLECTGGVCAYSQSSKSGDKCVATAECGPGLYCSKDVKCEPISDDAQDEGGPCGDSGDCKKGLVCDADVTTLFTNGPFGELSQECQDMLSGTTSAASPDGGTKCDLPKMCVKRGKKDTGSSCKTSAECLAGLYCVKFEDPVTMKEVQQCIGSPKALDQEPITIPSWDGEECPKDDSEAVAYFSVPRSDAPTDFYRLPFPNDIRKNGNKIDLTGHPVPPASTGVPVVERFIQAAGDSLTGFSTNPVIYFRFSQPVDAGGSSLSGASLHIVDISPGSPTYNNLASIEWSPSGLVSHYICPNWLAIRRPVGSPLRPGTTYAAILSRQVKTSKGATYKRSSDLDAMLDSNAPSDGALSAAYAAYAPLRAWLADPSALVASADVLNVAVFTTQSPEDVLPAMRTAIAADGAPKLKDMVVCDGNTKSPCDDGLGRGACHSPNSAFTEIHGHVSLPIFQKGTPPYDKPEVGGDIAFDGNKATVQSHMDVCFALSVPKAAAPKTGYPVMLYAHGTGGSFSDQMGSGLAQTLATSPTPSALFAIDMPEHGNRRCEATQSLMACDTSARPPEDLFFNFLNPQGARGNVLQGSADMMSLSLLIQGGSIPKDESPTGSAIFFDTKRVMLWGHSQGATHSSIALPFESGIQGGILSGVGGHLATSLLSKKKPVDIGSILPFVLFDADSNNKLVGGTYNPVLSLIQMYFDAADPVNYGHHLTRDQAATAPTGHHVFMVYGINDSYAPEKTQEAYARAADFKVVENFSSQVLVDLHLSVAASPLSNNVSAGSAMRTVGLREYDPTMGPLGGEVSDGHFVAQETQQGSDDVKRFFQQLLNGDTPQIGE